ncbi:MAG: pyrroline-5-carboxylate reductase [Geminicoccaceae bacterium]
MAALRGPILLIGGGKMGSAMMQGWLAQGLAAAEAFIVEPHADTAERLRADLCVHVLAAIDDLPAELAPSAMVLAVKPQVMAAVLPELQALAGRSGLVLSIAAGTSIATFEQAFGADCAIVRAMPNTPAAVGRGASALYANAACGDDARALAQTLLEAVGLAVWLDSEALMHAVTAMSGGGPAYVFHLIECLTSAGVAAGLPEHLAAPLARATVIGSGELAARSEESPAVLRQNVTSPGGTTAEALAVLMDDQAMARLFERAIAAAAERSRALA